MSDDNDASPPRQFDQLLDRLDRAHRRLEAAHADVRDAQAKSQRALGDVVGSIGDLADAVRHLVADEQADAGGDEPVGDDKADAAETEMAEAQPQPDGHDHPQNALPARLHSRGVPIPDQQPPDDDAEPAESGEPEQSQHPAEPASPPATPSSESRPAPAPAVPMHAPRLIDRQLPDSPSPFSGLDKDRRIVLTNDGFGVAPALNDLLSERGFRVRVESRRPELSAPADTVIFLGSLRAPSDLDDAMAVVDDAVVTADRMTTRLMQPDSAFVAVIDTAGGFGIGDFEPVTAPYGALLGLMRLLDRRHPGAATKLIDLDGSRLSGQQIAERIAAELLEGADQSPVGLGTDRRQTVEFDDFRPEGHPASWLDASSPPLVYMPGADAVLSTAIERLAIAHELPVAVLRRRHTPQRIARQFRQLGIDVQTTDYDLNRLFGVMDFLDSVRNHYGPIKAIVAESTPAKNPDELVRWEVMRPPLDEFNALLAMTINDPLELLGVGLGPATPPVVSSALRYFARAESLRRKDHLAVRLAQLTRRPPRGRDDFNPLDFAVTEFLAASGPQRAEVRFNGD